MVGVEQVTTESVDGRFAKDDIGPGSGRNGEEAKVFARTRGHAAPSHWACATQFGTDGLASGVAQQEDGVGSGVGVKIAGANQGIQQRSWQGAVFGEIAENSVLLVWHRLGQTKGRGWHLWRCRGLSERAVLFEPKEGTGKRELVQMDNQIDGATASGAAVPVEKLSAPHGEGAAGGVPFAGVVRIAPGPRESEDVGQRDGAQAIGPPALLGVHDWIGRLGRRLVQSRMLKTWLFSVRRSMRAAVRDGFLRKVFQSAKPRLEVRRVGFVPWRCCKRVKKRPTWAGSTSMYPSSSIYVELNISGLMLSSQKC